MSAPASFLVGDWGTSSLRLWRLSTEGAVLAETRAPEGLTAVRDGAFEAVLERHLGPLGAAPGEPVVLCGMVGARTGWIEANYLHAPLRLADMAAEAVRAPAAARPVFVLPGIAQVDPEHPDVMRGEETQLLGLVSLGRAEGPALACMPGTHSKWVRLDGAELKGFATFMTGEIFALLRRHSVLAGALDASGPPDPESESFRSGVATGLAMPAGILMRLFALRADFLLYGTPPQEGLSRLSGLLLGAELAGAGARWGALHGARLVASGAMAEVYRAALAVAGVTGVSTLDADDCARAGLLRAARRLAGAPSSSEAA